MSRLQREPCHFHPVGDRRPFLCSQALSCFSGDFRSLRFGRPSEPIDVSIPGTVKFNRNHYVGDLARSLGCAIQHIKGDWSSHVCITNSPTNLLPTGPLANYLKNCPYNISQTLQEAALWWGLFDFSFDRKFAPPFGAFIKRVYTREMGHAPGVPLSRPVGGQDPPLLGEHHHRRGHWRGHRCGRWRGLGARRGRSLDRCLAGGVPQPPGGPVAAQGLCGGRPLPEGGPPWVHCQAAAGQALTAQLSNLKCPDKGSFVLCWRDASFK